MKTGQSLKTDNWKLELQRQLPLFGHRNWIVVADSAYPAQSNPGIETIATGVDHAEVLQETLRAIASCKHVRAMIYIDAELKYVSEDDVPGSTARRDDIHRLLSDCKASELEHEQIISKLDESAKLFRVLVLKSTLTVPYTSVFLELDCGYWTADAEQRLRSSILSKKASVA
jgi:hypothetical protein